MKWPVHEYFRILCLWQKISAVVDLGDLKRFHLNEFIFIILSLLKQKTFDLSVFFPSHSPNHAPKSSSQHSLKTGSGSGLRGGCISLNVHGSVDHLDILTDHIHKWRMTMQKQKWMPTKSVLHKITYLSHVLSVSQAGIKPRPWFQMTVRPRLGLIWAPETANKDYNAKAGLDCYKPLLQQISFVASDTNWLWG